MRPKEYENKKLLKCIEKISEKFLDEEEHKRWKIIFYDIEEDDSLRGIISTFKMLKHIKWERQEELNELEELVMNDPWFKKRKNDIKLKDIEEDFK